MANIALNIRPLIDELFRLDIRDSIRSFRNQSKILSEWNALMKALKSVAPKIAKGENLGEELNEIRRLSTSLSRSAAEMGSMVPGPIGIVCSVALAIVCLIPPMDLLGFLLNLLGAIPFAKGATIGLKPILKNLLYEALQNPLVRGTIRAGRDASRFAVRYNQHYAVSAYKRILSNNNPFSALNIKKGVMPDIDASRYSLNPKLLELTKRSINKN